MTREPPDPLGILRELLDRANRQPDRFVESKRRATDVVATLSASEKLILSQIVAGWSSSDIAANHGIDVGDFESRRARLFGKINAGSTSEAVRIGIYAGL